MTVEAIAVLVAVGVPLIALAAVARLYTGLRGLERSRDELIELRLPRR